MIRSLNTLGHVLALAIGGPLRRPVHAEDYILHSVGEDNSDPETPPGCVLVGTVPAATIRRAVSQGRT